MEAATKMTMAKLLRAKEALDRAKPRGDAVIPFNRLTVRDMIRTDPDIYGAVKTLWNMGYRGHGLNLAIPSDRLPVGALHR